jgi:hypothetical protein
MTFFMFGLSVAAQRRCWKLFQETPTVHAAAEAGAEAEAVAAWLGAVVGVAPPPPHAAMTIAATATNAATLRFNIRFSFLLWTYLSIDSSRSAALDRSTCPR